MSAARRSGAWCSDDLHGARLETLSWMVVDIETDGLDPGRHAIREYAACAISAAGEISKVAAWSVEAEGPERFSLGLGDIAAGIRAGAVLVAHNLAFDMSFLATTPDVPVELIRPDRWLCTFRMLPARQSLDVLAARLGVPVEGRHTALGDARTLAGALVALLRRAEAAEAADVRGIVAIAPTGGRGSSAKRVASSPVAGWGGVRAELDHVVPCASVSREQRAAFRAATRLVADPRCGPAQLLEHDATVALLHGVRVPASALDVLVSELA